MKIVISFLIIVMLMIGISSSILARQINYEKISDTEHTYGSKAQEVDTEDDSGTNGYVYGIVQNRNYGNINSNNNSGLYSVEKKPTREYMTNQENYLPMYIQKLLLHSYLLVFAIAAVLIGSWLVKKFIKNCGYHPGLFFYNKMNHFHK